MIILFGIITGQRDRSLSQEKSQMILRGGGQVPCPGRNLGWSWGKTFIVMRKIIQKKPLKTL